MQKNSAVAAMDDQKKPIKTSNQSHGYTDQRRETVVANPRASSGPLSSSGCSASTFKRTNQATALKIKTTE
jgi:hypothetical protein